MSKTDDLSAWRVFVTVARSGTLSAAAKALDVEVSSISRAIGGLEKRSAASSSAATCGR